MSKSKGAGQQTHAQGPIQRWCIFRSPDALKVAFACGSSFSQPSRCAILINCLPIQFMVWGVPIVFPVLCIYHIILFSTIYLLLLTVVLPLYGQQKDGLDYPFMQPYRQIIQLTLGAIQDTSGFHGCRKAKMSSYRRSKIIKLCICCMLEESDTIKAKEQTQTSKAGVFHSLVSKKFQGQLIEGGAYHLCNKLACKICERELTLQNCMPIANHNPYLENQEVRQSSIVNTFLNTQNCITTQITEAHTNNKYTNYAFRSIACNKQSRAEMEMLIFIYMLNAALNITFLSFDIPLTHRSIFIVWVEMTPMYIK